MIFLSVWFRLILKIFDMINSLLLFSLSSLTTFNNALNDDDVVAFKLWARSDASLPAASRGTTSLHDATLDDNSIWIMGGQWCHVCVYRYFISNDTIITYDYLTNGGWTLSSNSAVLVNGIIFFLNEYGAIYTYDIMNKVESSSFIVNVTNLWHGCLTKHPDNSQIYVQGPQYHDIVSTQFYYIDINNYNGSNTNQNNALNYQTGV